MAATRKQHSIKQTPAVDQSKTPGVKMKMVTLYLSYFLQMACA